MLLAAADPAAIDATAARIVNVDVAGVPHLQMAYNQGIGQILEEQIEIIGASLNDLCMEWKPADITEGFREVLIPGLHLLTGC